ncbi:MAG: ABC transporter permease, partial [Planctomycetota bacterium]
MPLPIRYSIRNMAVRRMSTFLTAVGVALTVAVFAGVFALRSGLQQIYTDAGRDNLAIYLRQGATSEGESGIPRESAQILIKERPEIARNADEVPQAAAESYLAVYMEKVGGGLTNVPLRGVQPMSIELQGDALQLVDGRWMEFGTDEVVVGESVTRRMKNCRVGETIQLNVTPFKVVGVFRHDGVQNSEVWGDVERMMEALERPVYQRVVARVADGTDFEQVNNTLGEDPRISSLEVQSEAAYLASQTGALSLVLTIIAAFLTIVMGGAAIFASINTMLASVASRTHEIGVLRAIGYGPVSVFFAFVLESAAIGVLGGII